MKRKKQEDGWRVFWGEFDQQPKWAKRLLGAEAGVLVVILVGILILLLG